LIFKGYIGKGGFQRKKLIDTGFWFSLDMDLKTYWTVFGGYGYLYLLSINFEVKIMPAHI